MKTEHKLLILHLSIFYWVICLRIIVIRGFFIYSGDKSFLRYMFYKYFLHVTCVFVFLMTFFSKQTVSILIKLMISFFNFTFCACVLAKKSFSPAFSVSILSIYSLQSSCVSRQDPLHLRTAGHGPFQWTACARRGERRS